MQLHFVNADLIKHQVECVIVCFVNTGNLSPMKFITWYVVIEILGWVCQQNVINRRD